jgi:hypothetical protein
VEHQTFINLDKEISSAAKLSEVIKDQIGFSESWSTVPRTLRKICFGYRKFNNERKFLMERRNMRQTE